MTTKLLPILSLVVFAVAISDISLQAEDWKMPDGTVYQNVSVVKAEPDAVTILHHDGGGRIPMEKLPPELKERFHYDPATAQAAAQAREAQTEAEAQLAQAQQMADEALRRATAADPIGPTGSVISNTTGTGASEHHSVGELADSMHTLRDAGNPTHYSMGSLANSMHSL